MSLNFYSDIDALSIDGKDNLAIKLKTPSVRLQDKLDELNALKSGGSVNILIESAVVTFEEETLVGSDDKRFEYYQNDDGLWVRKENAQTDLELEGVDQYDTHKVEITADVIDQFILSQKVEYLEDKKFNPKEILAKISEGEEIDEISQSMKLATIDLVKKLNKARNYFAPFAAQWMSDKESKEDNG